jgi:hypothetical protein
MLYITSESSENDPTIDHGPIEKKIEQAERGELTLTEMKDLQQLLKSILEVKKASVERLSVDSHGRGLQ